MTWADLNWPIVTISSDVQTNLTIYFSWFFEATMEANKSRKVSQYFTLYRVMNYHEWPKMTSSDLDIWGIPKNEIDSTFERVACVIE